MSLTALPTWEAEARMNGHNQGYQAQENQGLNQLASDYTNQLLRGEALPDDRPLVGIYEYELSCMEEALQGGGGKEAVDGTLQSFVQSAARHPRDFPLGKLLGGAAGGGQEEQKKKYQPLSISGLLALPEQDWLLTNFLYEDAITVVYGLPGSAKSFLMVDWACHLALGLPWQGRNTQQCHVLYLATEGIRGYRRRILAWCHQHRYSPSILEDHLAFIPHAVPLRQKPEVLDLIATLQEYLTAFSDDRPIILILDTLFGCAAGVNINAPDAATLLIEQLQTMKEQLKLNHILVVHHSGKDTTRGMSGNMALKASTELSYHVEMDKDTRTLTLSSDRIKDDEDITVYLTLEKIVYGEGLRDNSCVILSGEKPIKEKPQSSIQQHMLAILEEFPDGIKSTAWLELMQERHGTPRPTFNDNLRRLKTDELIENTATDARPIYKRKIVLSLE